MLAVRIKLINTEIYISIHRISTFNVGDLSATAHLGGIGVRVRQQSFYRCTFLYQDSLYMLIADNE